MCCVQYPSNADVMRQNTGARLCVHMSKRQLEYESGLYSQPDRHFYSVIHVPFDYIVAAMGVVNQSTVVIGACNDECCGWLS